MINLLKEIFESFRGFLNHYSYEQWERFFMFLTLVVLVYWRIHYRHREDLLKGFKGENGLLEIPEAIILVWFYMFPFIIATTYFFKWPVDPQIWSFMEIILYVALGLRGAIETAKVIKGKPEDKKPDNPA